MPKKSYSDRSSSFDDEPPRKKSSNALSSCTDFKQGEIVTDLSGRSWELGKTIGIGGFGEIYEVSEVVSRGRTADNSFVAKVEKHTSGPLFVEINCYLRIGKLKMIEEWKKNKRLSFLGMPHYVASGSCYHNDEKYRFLILPKYKRDLGHILQEKKIFNIKTVANICIDIMNVLEYIHKNGYIHSDIKASNIMLGNQVKSMYNSDINTSNIMLGNKKKINLRSRNQNRKNANNTRNLRPVTHFKYIDDIPYLDEVLDIHHSIKKIKISEQNTENSADCIDENDNLDQVYLVDFGLASKYLSTSGEHKTFCTDERRAHAGTVLFCSRDAHKGAPSRRSDLESLAYNMVYWLTGNLPWIDDVEQPAEVEKKKIRCFRHLKSFLDLSFNNDYPQFVMDYFDYLNNLKFEETPDYKYCRRLFKNAITLYGYKKYPKFDFDNLEGWGRKQKKLNPTCKTNKTIYYSFLKTSPLMPLHSNVVYKRPKLRMKGKNVNVVNSMMSWSKILMDDPENIIKQAREKKPADGSDTESTSLLFLDINNTNPTYAMLDVFNKFLEREHSPFHSSSEIPVNIEGYTPAMTLVYNKMKERMELERRIPDSQKNGCVNKRKSKKTIHRTKSPLSARIGRAKCSNGQKKDSMQSQVKRTRNTTCKRNYSLRG